MKILPPLAGLLLALPALAQDAPLVLTSASPATSYGVLVMAPDSGCPASRVVVRANGHSWKSATLAPGQLAVVRMGHGFAAGDHALAIETLGCDQPALAARRVVLAKLSPDHGWRGGALN